MTEKSFNYATPTFLRHAAKDGFWGYAPPAPGNTGQFEFQTNNAAPQPYYWTFSGLPATSKRASTIEEKHSPCRLAAETPALDDAFIADTKEFASATGHG